MEVLASTIKTHAHISKGFPKKEPTHLNVSKVKTHTLISKVSRVRTHTYKSSKGVSNVTFIFREHTHT
jgi:hypothetical protein